MWLMLGRYTHIIWSSIWAIQEYEGVQVHVRAWYLIYYSSNKPGGLRVKNTCNIEVHSCKQVLYFLSLPLDNKSFSVRPGVKCKRGAKCKTGTANWGRNVDRVKTVLTIEFKREWGKKNENIQFTLYILYISGVNVPHMCMTHKHDHHLDFFRETVLFSLWREVCCAGYTDHYHPVHMNYW